MNSTINNSAQKSNSREKGEGCRKNVTAIINMMPAAVAVTILATSSSHSSPRLRRQTPV